MTTLRADPARARKEWVEALLAEMPLSSPVTASHTGTMASRPLVTATGLRSSTAVATAET
ncbi:hypothetical protein ACWEWG_00865 [Streptomyces sp. NPDC003758]